MTPLHVAAEKDHLKIVEYLADQKVDIDIQDDHGVHHSASKCMVVVAAACRKPLVNDEWAICLVSCTKGRRKTLLSPCRDSISGILGSF